jgi:hypothetical protein
MVLVLLLCGCCGLLRLCVVLQVALLCSLVVARVSFALRRHTRKSAVGLSAAFAMCHRDIIITTTNE